MEYLWGKYGLVEAGKCKGMTKIQSGLFSYGKLCKICTKNRQISMFALCATQFRVICNVDADLKAVIYFPKEMSPSISKSLFAKSLPSLQFGWVISAVTKGFCWRHKWPNFTRGKNILHHSSNKTLFWLWIEQIQRKWDEWGTGHWEIM